MKLRLKWLFLAILVMALLTFSHSYGQNKFKLKPGAQGQLCLDCHDTFKEKLKNPFVHTPVKTGDCTGCHNPHTSSHGKLLAEDPNKICVKCHEGIVPQNPKSVHPVVMQGNCVKCHDPHASKYKFVLLKPGNELCLDCHKNIGDAVAKARFKHAPVDKGCVSCHDPHGSAKGRYLLKNELVSLCVSCHRTDQPSFSKQHMNYPVAKSNCSSCHDAHGSNRAGILFDNVHPPVANKVCTQCHEAPTSPDALKTKRTGFELCRGCHSRMMNDVFSKNRIHWPLVDQKGCLNCHKPHASPQKNLLRGDMNSLCGKCHIDALESQKKLAEKEKQEKRRREGEGDQGRPDTSSDPARRLRCLSFLTCVGQRFPFEAAFRHQALRELSRLVEAHKSPDGAEGDRSAKQECDDAVSELSYLSRVRIPISDPLPDGHGSV